MLTVTDAIALEDVKKELLEFCQEPQGGEAILNYLQLESTKTNYSKYIVKLLDQRFLTAGLSHKQSFAKRTFVITQKGLNYLKAIS